MTDLTALKELLERVEKAERPDREIDAAVYVSLFIPRERAGRIDVAIGYVGWWPKDGPYESAVEVDRYTSSIDACVALIEKVLPDWTAWELLSRGGKTRFFVQISKLGPDDEEIYADGRGPTPPLAFLAALLSALIAKEEGK